MKLQLLSKQFIWEKSNISKLNLTKVEKTLNKEKYKKQNKIFCGALINVGNVTDISERK